MCSSETLLQLHPLLCLAGRIKKKHKVNEWVNRVCDFDKKLRIHLQMSHSALLLLPTNFQTVTERFFSPDFDHIMVCETTEKSQICASLGLIK